MKIAKAIVRATGAGPAGGHSACFW